MRRRWVIVSITCMALICAGIVVHAYLNNRRLAKVAATYRIRAERGDAKSQYSLGAMYYYGKGVPKDYIEAVRWFQKSAEQEDSNAQYTLSRMYHLGQGLPQDDSEAARWYRKSAEQGYPQAQYDLGYMYYYGYGVAQDRVEATRLFEKAAAQGNKDAIRALDCSRKGISIDPGAGLRGLH